MKKLLILSFIATSILAICQGGPKVDRQVQGKFTAGRTTVELVGGCSFLNKVDCWDMTGKRNPSLTQMVKAGAKEGMSQVEIGFRMTNRLVIYRTTRQPFFPKGSLGGEINVDTGSGNTWISQSRRPGEKGAPIEEEYRVQVCVVPKGTKSLSIKCRVDSPTPEVSIPFRVGADAKLPLGRGAKIEAIRPAKPGEKSRGGTNRPSWVIEISGGGYPTPVDAQGRQIGMLDSKGVPTDQPGGAPASFFSIDPVGMRQLYLITIDPKYIAKLKFQNSSSTTIEITGAPANPR